MFFRSALVSARAARPHGVVRGFRGAARRHAKVLFVGLTPEVVDYEKWAQMRPEMGLTEAKLRAGLALSLKQISDLGHEAVGCWVDTGATAEAVVRAELEKGYECVVIGAGVRTDPDHMLLFETLVNAVHEAAPAAKICFNTSPDSSAAAVQRWLKDGDGGVRGVIWSSDDLVTVPCGSPHSALTCVCEADSGATSRGSQPDCFWVAAIVVELQALSRRPGRREKH
eukprot:CAMPEP_0185716436 /NCGR_PEP_ID=MMETSP1164-20130828/42785_1 /TAXON_ID=1104430 /ORGANISM="Chrysoreinhardia sp, Strain CCMP2950" /LENGTH=225 /DNA_ID=CAMNT_0028384055 /DNA_START=42 /DNA_END=720 /DNA_ORIENTATION=-